MTNPAADPVPMRFRAALAELYGERLERAVPLGSRARRRAAGFEAGGPRVAAARAHLVARATALGVARARAA